MLILYSLTDDVTSMTTPLNVSTLTLLPGRDDGRIFDMTGRCAFAICQSGDFDIRIMNVTYHVNGLCIIACMPFINVEIMRVRTSSHIILGGMHLQDVLSIINRNVNSINLLSIQQSPLAHITDAQFTYLQHSIEGFLNDLADTERHPDTGSLIHDEIIRYHSRLIVAQVMKVYFDSVKMDFSGHHHRDFVFQHFLLNLHAHFREQHHVGFYAARSGVSEKYFSTIIRQLTGSSPSQWIQKVVITEAKLLLSDHQRNIKDIASTLNFPDAPTFTKYFRRATGLTPNSYRLTLNI